MQLTNITERLEQQQNDVVAYMDSRSINLIMYLGSKYFIYQLMYNRFALKEY